ncbi:unnamed protein product [Mucor hiemalis]
MKFSFNFLFEKIKNVFEMGKTATAKDFKVSDEELTSLKEAFNLYDTDKNGAIDVKQFADILKSLNITSDDSKLKAIIEKVDKNHNGQIDFEEFVTAMTNVLDSNGEPKDTSLKKWNTHPETNTKDKKRSYTRSLSRHETDDLKLCFEKFDNNGDGQISFEELKDVINGLGDKLTEQELKDMMKDADTNNDGFIDFEEFKALVPKENDQ